MQGCGRFDPDKTKTAVWWRFKPRSRMRNELLWVHAKLTQNHPSRHITHQGDIDTMSNARDEGKDRRSSTRYPLQHTAIPLEDSTNAPSTLITDLSNARSLLGRRAAQSES